MYERKFSLLQCDVVYRDPESCTSAFHRPSSLWSMWVPRVMQKGCAWMLEVVLSPSWYKFFDRNLSYVTRQIICSVQLSLSFQHLSGRTGFTLVIIKLNSFVFNSCLVCHCMSMLSAWKLRTYNNEWDSATNEEHFPSILQEQNSSKMAQCRPGRKQARNSKSKQQAEAALKASSSSSNQ